MRSANLDNLTYFSEILPETRIAVACPNSLPPLSWRWPLIITCRRFSLFPQQLNERIVNWPLPVILKQRKLHHVRSTQISSVSTTDVTEISRQQQTWSASAKLFESSLFHVRCFPYMLKKSQLEKIKRRKIQASWLQEKLKRKKTISDQRLKLSSFLLRYYWDFWRNNDSCFFQFLTTEQKSPIYTGKI